MKNKKKPSQYKQPISYGVGLKVYAIVGLVLVFLISIAVYSVYQMSNIGREIEGIAERDLPLNGALMKVTTHQLEQAIQLERALRLSGTIESQNRSKALYEKSFKKFKELALIVEKEIVQAETIAKTALNTTNDPKTNKLFKEVAKELKKVRKFHKSFDKHAFEIFQYTKEGNISAASANLPTLMKEEEYLTKALEEMLFKVEGFTEHAAKIAEEHEKFALKVLVILSLVATGAGIILSWFLVRKTIITPLSEVINGLNALAEDDMSVDVKVYSHDEIGSVAKAYRVFKETLQKAKELKEQQEIQKQKAEEERKKIMRQMAEKFDESVGDIISTVASASAELSAAAQSMAGISEETSSQATSVCKCIRTDKCKCEYSCCCDRGNVKFN